jgi:two-component system nitrate/nitrite response regulator NarL
MSLERGMATVAVLGSSPLFRAGLVSLLGTMGFGRVEEAENIRELKIEELKRRANDASGSESGPDILLVALLRGAEDFTHLEGFTHLIEEIRTWVPQAKVVFLATDLDLDLLSGCFAAGANGYLLENISCDSLEESLKLVCTGAKVFPSELALLIPGLACKLGGSAISTSELRDFDLSDREIEILRCLTDGQTNKIIAKELNIAEATVKVHVKRILRKTHASNRTQAALWGVVRGVAPESSLMLRKVAS